MNQGDIEITCLKAIQYLNRNEAKLLGDVVVKQDTVNIYTERGYYFGDDKIAYSDTSVLLDDGRMMLSADEGYYYFDEERAYFLDNVELYDTVTTLNSDELTYFHKEDKAVAVRNVKISDSTSAIFADSLIHYRNIKETYAFYDIKITNSENNIVILGEELTDIGSENYTSIRGNPLLIQIDTTESGIIDTLLISSKLMESVKDSLDKLIATDSVKIVRGKFSSKNSKTIYIKESERIVTYKPKDEKRGPVLWYANSQLLGDTVYISLVDNSIDMIDILKNAFILSEDSLYNFRFDQISGGNIKLFFKENNLSRTEVYSSVLSIYYLYDESGPSGLIKSSSESAKIFFEDSRVVDVRLFGSPASEYHPENLVAGNEKDFTLPSFVIYNERPTKEMLLQHRKLKSNR
jgi:lipopolysaccharide export system protein LptA